MKMNEKIKSLRLQKGLTLEQVGNFVGVSKATVLKWENGIIQNMKRDKIAKLATILGTTPDNLMGWDENEKPTAGGNELSEKDEMLIDMMSKLSDEKFAQVLEYAKFLLSQQ